MQNRHADVVRVLIDAKEVNVLEKNGFGRSPLTDGFSGGETSIVKALLEHPSATEEALLGGAKTEDVPADEAKGDEAEDASVTHELDLVSRREPARADDDARAVEGPAPHAGAGAPPLRVRELPMSDAKLFGSSAQDDTTGLGIWAASIVLARWAVDLGAARLGGRVVCELGAGCGVPGLAAALHCAPRRVILGDLNARALDNLRHNVALNGFGARPPAESARADGTTPTVEIMPIEWEDPSTWPRAVDGADDGAAHVDVILGADLVYQASAVEPFVRAVSGMLRPGGECFYAGPESGRDGLAEVVSRAWRLSAWSSCEKCECPRCTRPTRSQAATPTRASCISTSSHSTSTRCTNSSSSRQRRRKDLAHWCREGSARCWIASNVRGVTLARRSGLRAGRRARRHGVPRRAATASVLARRSSPHGQRIRMINEFVNRASNAPGLHCPRARRPATRAGSCAGGGGGRCEVEGIARARTKHSHTIGHLEHVGISRDTTSHRTEKCRRARANRREVPRRGTATPACRAHPEAGAERRRARRGRSRMRRAARHARMNCSRRAPAVPA